MYNCFKKITIVKPNTSRPANSERFVYSFPAQRFFYEVTFRSIIYLFFFWLNRYLVCKWKCDNTESIRDHMFMVNEAFNKHGEACDTEVNEIVPLSIIKNDTEFYNYIYSSNNE